MDVLLWVPYDDPTTLYYDLGDPGIYGIADAGGPTIPRTRIERTLYLCLMSFRTFIRDQAWRNAAQDSLPKWRTSYDSDRSQIVVVDLPLDDASSDFASPEQTTSEYLTLLSPITRPRATTRAAASCAPLSDQHPRGDTSDSEADPAAPAGQKRRFSLITSSPPTQRPASRADRHGNQSGRSRSHDAPFCTQRCLRGLQQGGPVDPACPNTGLHILGRTEDRHPISAVDLVKMLKAQLNHSISTIFLSFHLITLSMLMNLGVIKGWDFGGPAGLLWVGVTPVQVSHFHRDQRYQILPAYAQDGVVLSRVFRGSTDAAAFEDFIEQLLEHCGRWPEPKSVIIMDNASFHHTDRLDAMCSVAGVKLVYLPPYSPDLNPIEEFFGELKRFIRRNWQVYTQDPSQGFDVFLEWCVDIVGARKLNAQGHFRHAGVTIEEL